MTLELDLPPEVKDAYGDKLERKVLEGLLLQMVQEGRLSVAKAGSLLGLDRLEAIRWYTSFGLAFPNWDHDEWQRELEIVEQQSPKSTPS
jgi:hypothetical protein